MKKLFSFAVVLFLLFAVGCSHEDNGLHGRADAGEQISFTATIGSTSAATKAPASSSFRISDTRFSGDVVTVTGSNIGHERLDWADDDKITIAQKGDAQGSGYENLPSDYEMSLDGTDPASATLTLAAGNGHQWRSGETNSFVALYPSATDLGFTAIATTGNPGSYLAVFSKSAGTFDYMPSTQYCTLEGTRNYNSGGTTEEETWYAPNMRYAYMTAGADVSSSSIGSPVSLEFSPQFSSVEVKLVKPSDMSGSTVKLVSAVLTGGVGESTDTDLSGEPAMTLEGCSGLQLLVSGSAVGQMWKTGGATGNSVTVEFKDSESAAETSSPELNESTPLSFTFLLLPVDVTQLELELTLEVTKDGITKTDTKTLQLKEANGWIDLPAGKKLTVTNMETWIVDVVGPSAFTEKIFTVSAEGKKVKFSPGNLQAVIAEDNSANNARWQFADHQYDNMTTTTGGPPYPPYSAAVSKVVDLFQHPESTTGTYAYGIPVSSSYNPSSTNFADWGGNRIYKSSAADATLYLANTYRTLTNTEWDYLLNHRLSGATVGGTSDARYSMVTVEGKYGGMLIYPDGFIWNTSTMGAAPTSVNAPSQSSGFYSGSSWKALEKAGVVFLPAAGYCSSSGSIGYPHNGYYWSASVNGADNTGACHLYLNSNDVGVSDGNSDSRRIGLSVRLVKDVVPEFTVSLDGQKVAFSPGNLQAVIQTANSAKDAIWRFADEQYEYHATDGGTYSAEVNDIVDVFMHPESGDVTDPSAYAFGIPMSTSYNPNPTTLNFEDWGQNPIYPNSDPTSTPYAKNTYRTLEHQEWNYLLKLRESGATVGDNSNACYSLVTLDKAFVGGTDDLLGMLIYPNGFTWTSAMGAAPDVTSPTEPTGPYTLEQFRAMESAGVVFLPAAGLCYGNRSFDYVASNGCYWSASIASSTSLGRANYLSFSPNSMFASGINYRFSGFSVRLVRNLD